MIVKSPCRQIQGESGTALLASVLLISLITGAGLTALAMTSVSLNIASNLLPSKQAFYLAEAGIQHGKSFLSQNRNNWTTYASAQAQTLLPYTSLASTGGYSVTVQDGGGGSLLINSTGTGPDRWYKAHDRLPGNLLAVHTPGPTEAHYSFYLEREGGVVFCADLLTNAGVEGLAFVAGEYQDEPARTRESVRRFLDLKFETLCTNHGDPVTVGAKEAIVRALAYDAARGGE